MKLEADDPLMGSGKAWCALPIDEKISLLPEEIRPAAPFKGQWSYIVHSPNNLAAVQVLLKPRPFLFEDRLQRSALCRLWPDDRMEALRVA